MEMRLFCAHCLTNGVGMNNANMAVTIMDGDAVCKHHMLGVLERRRALADRRRRIEDLETTGGRNVGVR